MILLLKTPDLEEGIDDDEEKAAAVATTGLSFHGLPAQILDIVADQYIRTG